MPAASRTTMPEQPIEKSPKKRTHSSGLDKLFAPGPLRLD